MFINEPPAPHESTVILVSGGLDSAVTLALARLNTCRTLHAISINYGQTHERELASAAHLTQHYRARTYSVDMRDQLWLFEDRDKTPGIRTSSYTEEYAREADNPPLLPRTWIPGRNIAFLNYAASYAWYCGSNLVAAGIHQEDQPGYPDCREAFLWAMETALREGLAYTLSFWMPLLHMTKAQIVELGARLKVPFELTWTCYKGEDKPCRECDACVRRAKAFQANNLVDPLLKGGKT